MTKTYNDIDAVTRLLEEASPRGSVLGVLGGGVFWACGGWCYVRVGGGVMGVYGVVLWVCRGRCYGNVFGAFCWSLLHSEDCIITNDQFSVIYFDKSIVTII